MKIMVMGSGAVGGYYGALLHQSGEQVRFVARGEHLRAIQKRGLQVESVARGGFTIHPDAVDRPDGSWQADLVLFCVKSYHNPEAIEAMRPAVGRDTSILTLQNGIGSGDELAVAFGREKVLLGASYVNAGRRAPGVVAELGGPSHIIFGEPDGGVTPRADEVRDVLQRASIAAELSPDVATAIWEKLVYICALSGMTCITNAPFSEVLDTPQTLDLTWRVLREAASVGRASGVSLSDTIVEETMDEFQSSEEELTSSMHLDLQRGNRLEVGVLNGAVVRIGKDVGVDTPVNEFITACLTVAHNRASAGAVEQGH